MNLNEYEGRMIRVTFADGDVLTGLGDAYVSELDSPDGIETLSLYIKEDGRLIDFTADEVKHIEIIA